MYLSDSFISFIEHEDTLRIPLYAEDAQEETIQAYFCFAKKASSGKMFEDSVCIRQDWMCEWDWSAYAAGERAIARINEWYNLSGVLQGMYENAPIHCDVYDELLQSCGGGCTIRGYESAYLHGKKEFDTYTLEWEAYPFIVLNHDETAFEDASYVYYRMLIPMGDGREQIQEFLIADQQCVREAFSVILDVNASIDSAEKQEMRAFAAPWENEDENAEPIPEGLEYEISLDSVTITGYKGSERELKIPARIKGRPVLSIGDEAFWDSANVTSIVIPEGVEHIGYQAFAYCYTLESLTLPESLKQIDDQALRGCRNIRSVQMKEEHPIFECRNGFLIDKSVGKLLAYWGTEEEVVIADGVKEIAACAFYGNEHLTCVTMPYGVKKIGSLAFASCSNLQQVGMADTVASIGERSFAFCGRLREINISKGVRVIEKGVFAECRSLAQVVIPEGVESIMAGAFERCDRLREVYIAKSVMEIDKNAFPTNEKRLVIHAENGSKSLDFAMQNSRKYAYSMNMEVKPLPEFEVEDLGGGLVKIAAYNGWRENVVIPGRIDGKRVSLIDEHAFFNNMNVKSVIVSEGVSSIAKGAFSGCQNLESVQIADSVVRFGIELFQGCSKLKNVSLGEGMKEIPYGMFNCCRSLERIQIPRNVSKIGDSAFQYCEMLSHVILPQNLIEIQQGAFRGCSALKKLTIPASVERIDAEAFRNCVGMTVTVTENTFGDLYASNYLIDATVHRIEAVQEMIIIKAKMTADDKEMREEMHEESEAVHPALEWEIADDQTIRITGFTGDTKKLVIPGSIEGKPVTVIGEEAFKNNKTLNTVVISNGVKQIEDGAFYGSGVVHVQLPGSVASIGWEAFEGCTALESINLPDSITEIGNRAFNGCRALREIVLPCEITKISGNMFRGCKALKSIQIPKSVKHIGEMAFFECQSLTDIDMPMGLLVIGEQAFYRCEALRSICIPDTVMDMGAEVFAFCSDLMYVDLPEALLHLPDGAFRRCKMLLDVKMPSTLKSIGDNAFSECVSLKQFEIPQTVRNIGSSAFDGCVRFLEVTIPEGVPVLQAGVFSTANMERIRIPQSVIHIDGLVFSGNKKLSIEVAEGSYAEQFVRSHGFAYSYYTPEKQSKKTVSLTEAADFEVEKNRYGHVVIKKYVGTKARIRIPDQIDGCPVTEIGKQAFEKCYFLEEVIIPDSVDTIGAGAFSWCCILEKITLPKELKKLEAACFEECRSLLELRLPEGLKEIGSRAIWVGRALRRLEIPASVEKIGRGALTTTPNIGSVKSIRLTVRKGSAAEAYAKENKLNYQVTYR